MQDLWSTLPSRRLTHGKVLTTENNVMYVSQINTKSIASLDLKEQNWIWSMESNVIWKSSVCLQSALSCFYLHYIDVMQGRCMGITMWQMYSSAWSIYRCFRGLWTKWNFSDGCDWAVGWRRSGSAVRLWLDLVWWSFPTWAVLWFYSNYFIRDPLNTCKYFIDYFSRLQTASFSVLVLPK